MSKARYPYKVLLQFVEQAFSKLGHSTTHAKQGAEVLLASDLRGIESHGLQRLENYARLCEQGRINAQPHFNTIEERAATACIDADAAMGLISAPYAMALAVRKAKQAGAAWVGVRNSNHFGIAAYHSMLALSSGMVGIAMTHATPLVAPTGSKERMLGTNPISVAIPAGRRQPFVMDMATTVSSSGKIALFAQQGQSVPSGWLQNAEGQPSEDAASLQAGGTLLPLGSDTTHGIHKGYCLGSWVDIFCGPLTGANYGPWVPPFVHFLQPSEAQVGKGIGHMLGAIDIEAFRSYAEFCKEMENWVDRFKAAKRSQAKVPVLVPGEPEAAAEKHHLKTGIKVPAQLSDRLRELGRRLNIASPFSK